MRVIVHVELEVFGAGQASTAKVDKVLDAIGQDRTKDFLKFCESQSLPLTNQLEIETAAEKYGVTFTDSLP